MGWRSSIRSLATSFEPSKRYFGIRTDALPWLFISEREQPLTRQSENNLVAMAAERAELAPVHPHMLRHSCGFYLANRGYDLRLIQDYLGHRDPKHTVQLHKGRSQSLRGALAMIRAGFAVSDRFGGCARMKLAFASMRCERRAPPILAGATAPVISTRLSQRTAVAGPISNVRPPVGASSRPGSLSSPARKDPSTAPISSPSHSAAIGAPLEILDSAPLY